MLGCSFQINFPPDGFLSAGEIPKLEQLLPPRDESIVPEDAEEVDLVKIDPQEQARSRMHHGVSVKRESSFHSSLLITEFHAASLRMDLYLCITASERQISHSY